jgi:UDP-3-O-[3-hydroxymyristoyl] glucosamine N-acyltransferase
MVSRSLSGPGVYSSGIPIEESRVWRRQIARFRSLESLTQRVRRLERAAGAEQDEDDD